MTREFRGNTLPSLEKASLQGVDVCAHSDFLGGLVRHHADECGGQSDFRSPFTGRRVEDGVHTFDRPPSHMKFSENDLEPIDDRLFFKDVAVVGTRRPIRMPYSVKLLN
jgi:hypothetical protein